jgi:hypothetical protein
MSRARASISSSLGGDPAGEGEAEGPELGPGEPPGLGEAELPGEALGAGEAGAMHAARVATTRESPTMGRRMDMFT